MLDLFIIFNSMYQNWYLLFMLIIIVLSRFVEYKWTERKKLLKLLLSKYSINDDNKLILSSKTQINLFNELIYHYFVCHQEISLKSLAEFYFINKDYYFKDQIEQSLLSVVLRWETDIGVALIKEVIENNRTVDGKKLTWIVENKTFNLHKWHSLYSEVISYILQKELAFRDLYNFDYIDNYLNLDFIPFQKLAGNNWNTLENLSLNNAKICESFLIFPDVEKIVFDKLHIYKSRIMGINFKNAVYANNIILEESSLIQSSLISPRDQKNNIDINFKKLGFCTLVKSFFTKSKKKILFEDLELTSGTSIKSKELYDYYNWYSYYVKNDRKKNRLSSFADLLITKYYTSVWNILISTILFIFLYALAMYLLDGLAQGLYFKFNEPIKREFLSFLYLSMTNFTTLGFGEVIAIHWSSYLIVALEVFTGYYMLAMLVAVASKREMKYS